MDWKDELRARKQRALLEADRVTASPRWVGWIGVMGTRSAVLVSHAAAATTVLRLHDACLRACKTLARADVHLAPMNDGVFVLGARRDPVLECLAGTFSRLALHFATEDVPNRRIMVRGAVAVGAVSSADDVLAATSGDDARRGFETTPGVFLGLPLLQTAALEREAPPFGIAVHETARWPMRDGDGLPERSFAWWGEDHALRVGLATTLLQHFAWAAREAPGYPDTSRRRHESLVRSYFGMARSDDGLRLSPFLLGS